MKRFICDYYWALILSLTGGILVSTIAYNVMGRLVGFENLPLTSLVPGFSIGSISALIISYLVIRNRKILLQQLAAEQRIALDLKAEIVRREKVEVELLISKEKADIANRTKSEFLANMSHELRTPLNAIIGFSDTILSEIFGPVQNRRYEEYLQDIKQSGLHLLNIINDILDLSKIEVGESKLYESPIDISELISACLLLVKQRAKEKNQTLNVVLENGQTRLFADEQKLKQILINLLTNSIKFTSDGGVISIKGGAHAFGYELQVADNGIGIAPENLETVMTPFQQIDGALSRKYQGTGLGLPICKSLTEMHGGIMELKSDHEKGTTVSIRLPGTRVLAEGTGTPALLQ